MTTAVGSVCATCGKSLRPGSVICLGCGQSLVRVPKRQQAPMLIPAIVLGIMFMILVAYLASSLGA